MKKKRNLLFLITIVLAMVVVIGGGYLVYNEVFKKEEKDLVEKDTNKKEEEEEQVVALDINSDLVKELLEGIKPYPCLDTYFYEEKHQNLLAEDFDFQRKYVYAVQRLKNIKVIPDPQYTNLPEELDDGVDHWMFEVSEEEMKKALENALGEKAILEKETLSFDNTYMISFIYDENGEKKYGNLAVTYNELKNTFTVKMNDGGGCGSGNDIVKVESASKKGKNVTIIEKAMFIEEIGEVETATEFGVYSDLEHKKEIGRVKIEEFFANPEVANTYLEKAMVVTYTFEENEDGSYHFVSSKITN